MHVLIAGGGTGRASVSRRRGWRKSCVAAITAARILFVGTAARHRNPQAVPDAGFELAAAARARACATSPGALRTA